MKKSILVLAALLLGASAVQAGDWFGFGRGVKGSGDLVEEVREVEAFDRIDACGSVDVVIFQGDQQKVTVIFDDNLVDLIETDVRRGCLQIDARRSYRTRERCRVEVVTPTLTEIASSGSGDVEVDQLKAEDLEIMISGSGDLSVGKLETDYLSYGVHGSGDGLVDDLTAERFKLSIHGSGDFEAEGSVQDLRVRVNGSGDVDLRDVTAQDARVRVSGSGEVKVTPVESLDASVAGSGDIFYYGSPNSIDTRSSGSGDIRKR